MRLFSNRSSKWHTSRRRENHWCFLPHFYVLCDLLLPNKPTATWNRFVLYNEQKRQKKKKKKKTTNLPRTTKCSRICVSLSIFVVTNGFLVSAPYFHLYWSHYYTVHRKSLSGHPLAQSRILAETFWKLRVYRSNDTRWQRLWRFLPV